MLLVSLGGYTIANAGPGPGEITVTWSAPTECTDGSPFGTLPGDCMLNGFKIYYSLSDSEVKAKTAPVIDINNKDITVHTITGLESNTQYYVAMTAYGWEGIESDLTESVIGYAGSVITPNPVPSVALTTTVYNVIKKVNGFVLLPVGNIPLNTPCDNTQTVNGYTVVPRAAVTWSGTIKPDVVVAKCGQN